MFYVIVAEDVPGSLEQRLAARPAHRERLRALQDEGRVIVAGACPAIDGPDPGPAGFTGSVIVAEFDSLAQAESWAEADPFVAAGVYAKVTVKPFARAFPM
ncbi:MAG: YciI family protein [Candidatus Accumulibacter sp.]|nr:YciI family protein [Accumulibacter sp.]